MALTVETGAGLEDADSFVSVDMFKAYQGKIGNDLTDYSDDLIEQALRRSSSFLSNSFTWQGFRTHGRDQALSWPRSGAVDQEGWGIKSDEIPTEIINAVCEVGWREVEDPGSMNPDFKATELIKSEKIGPMSTEYALSDTSPDALRPVLTIVRDMVSQFLATGAGSSISGSSYRV